MSTFDNIIRQHILTKNNNMIKNRKTNQIIIEPAEVEMVKKESMSFFFMNNPGSFSYQDFNVLFKVVNF